MIPIAPHLIQEQDNITFNRVDYSKFKFGSKKVARKFGFELAEHFIRTLQLSTYKGEQFVVCSSPYCFIPTATYAMKDYFVQRLNEWLMAHNYPVVQEAKIHRTITYKEDYGELSAEDRMKLIGGDHFHMDREFVKGKTVLFLDDIRITGSHEKMIERMVKELALECDYKFMYFAILDNVFIHPNIENELNYYFVKDLLNLDKIIKNEDFLLNTRVVKYLLNYGYTGFATFIQFQKQSFVNSLYHAAIGNSYHTIEDYQKNFNYLKTLVK
jgi:hypothetical protein